MFGILQTAQCWCKGRCWKQGLGSVWPKNCSWMSGFWFGHACSNQLKFKQCPEVLLAPVRPKDTSEVRCGVKSGFPVASNWVKHSAPRISLNPYTFSKNEIWRWCYFTWIKTWRVLCPACLSQNIMFSIKGKLMTPNFHKNWSHIKRDSAHQCHPFCVSGSSLTMMEQLLVPLWHQKLLMILQSFWELVFSSA